MGVNKTVAAYYFHRLRTLIYEATEESSPINGEVEVDESYVSDQCKGRKGRGSAGTVPVLGLLKRGGKVYTKVIPDAKDSTLMLIIRDSFNLL